MKLRDYQREAIDGIYDYYSNNPAAGNLLDVLPTGAGKSVVIGTFCKEVVETWPNQRILMLTHVKELIAQNFEKLKAIWPESPAGIYCASLNKRQHAAQIVYGSIQSLYRKPHLLGWRDIIIVDEAHLISPSAAGMYNKLFSALKETNSRIRVIGFTATPFRSSEGCLVKTKGALFDHIIEKVTLSDLVERSYLSPLTSKSSIIQADLSNIRTTAGEYNARDMESEFDRDELTDAALDEVIPAGADRLSWLFFCSGIKHAEHVRDKLIGRGIPAGVVHSKMPKAERDRAIADYKSGKTRALANSDVLTTGFDDPKTDMLVLLRATQSPVLYIQIMGRGMRIYPGKSDCLVMDYGGNVERHGPVTHVRPPQPRAAGKKKKTVAKSCIICPDCRSAWPLGALECGDCGKQFERINVIEHETKAFSGDIMGGSNQKDDWRTVDDVEYFVHNKNDKKTMRVEYRCGLQFYKEWVCFEHEGFPRRKAEHWWGLRRAELTGIPETVGEAIGGVNLLKKPTQIKVGKNGKYTEIKGFNFGRPVGLAKDDGVSSDS